MASRRKSSPTCRSHLLKLCRPAFTLIEVLVSVVILATSIFYIMRIYTQNHEQSAYIMQRSNAAMSDSLFLVPKVLNFSEKKESAYDLLRSDFAIENEKIRKILQNLSRTVQTSHISAVEEYVENENLPQAAATKIMLKENFSSSYIRFKVSTF